jgi:hypothetical protein
MGERRFILEGEIHGIEEKGDQQAETGQET